MTLSAWRITKQKHIKSAFNGEGARLYGGRWNSSGTPMIYTAQSQSLAVLQVLVDLDSPELLKRYFLFEVVMDASYVGELDLSSLPRNWKADPVPTGVQAMGDDHRERTCLIGDMTPAAEAATIVDRLPYVESGAGQPV